MATAEPSVTCISYTPDSSTLLWLSACGTLRSFCHPTLLTATPVPNARLLSAGSEAIALCDAVTPCVRFASVAALKLLPYVARGGVITGNVIALTPPVGTNMKGIYAVVGGRGVRVRGYGGEDMGGMDVGDGAIVCARFDDKGKVLVVGDMKGTVRVLRVDGRSSRVIERAHRALVASVSVGGGVVYSGGWDGYVRGWEIAEDGARKVVQVRGDRKKVLTVAGGMGGEFVTGGIEGVVRVWNARGMLVAEHWAHRGSVYVLEWESGGRHVVSGGQDGSVRVFGVPTKPELVERKGVEMEGVIVKGQRADRRLVFCHSGELTLECPVCLRAYNSGTRRPMVSAKCGHTFACAECNERLWESDVAARCPLCRKLLQDVAPNYQLLQVLQSASASGTADSEATPAFQSSRREDGREDYIELHRLSWLEAPELALVARPSCVVYKGHLDGEAVAIRLPSASPLTPKVAVTCAHVDETERHLHCLRQLRGPHMPQFYGVSRLSPPDNRLVIVSELFGGGTLATNLSLFRRKKQLLAPQAIVSLSLQIARGLRFLHASGTSAGWALSAEAICLPIPLSSDWAAEQRIKFAELGGTISRTECVLDVRREFPSGFARYMGPELLDEDRSKIQGRDEMFRRFCMGDLYALGVLIWEIGTLEVAWEGKRAGEIVGAVVGRGEHPGAIPEYLPEEVGKVIGITWGRERERGSIAEVCEILERVPSAPSG